MLGHVARRAPRRPHPWRLLAYACLCAAFAAAVGASGSVPRPATGGSVLAACSGLEISAGAPTSYFATPAGLSTPVDGRLNGLDFSLDVLGYADRPCLPSSQPGAQGVAAPRGQSVAVVSYRLDTSPGWDTTATTHLAFVVDGRVVPILGADYSAGWNHWALSVPRAAKVGFEVIDAGSTQELSLRTGRRVTRSPLALYRPRSGSKVSAALNESRTLVDVDRAQNFSQPDRFELLSADLTWFSPVDPLVHAGMRGAFLQVDLAEQAPAKYSEVGWSESLPPGRMRLVLPNGRVLASDPASTTTPSGADLLSGTYFFDVPWDFTRGVLEVTPGTIPALSNANGAPMTVTVEGTARFPVSLPPPRAYRGHHAAAGAVRLHHRPVRRAVRHHRPTGRSGMVQVLLIAVPTTVVLVAVMLLVLPVFIRRRQRRLGPYAFDAGGAGIEPDLVGTPSLAAVSPFPGAEEGRDSADREAAVGEAAEDGTDEARTLSNKPAPYVAVMGDVAIRDLELPTKRLIAIELLCFLACHAPRRFTAEEIRSALWPLTDDGKERVSSETFRSYVSAARRAAGAGNFPKPSGRTYGLGPEVETDWHRFQRLVERAGAVEGEERRRLLDEALGLVRGPIFSAVPKGRYEWALSGGLVSAISVAVIEAAGSLANSCLEDGVPNEAIAGLERALVATSDIGVADDLLTAAGATGNPAALDRAWGEILAVLGKNAAILQRSFEAIRGRLSELDPVD